MSLRRVARNYRAVYRSQPIAFAKGATVDVDDETADWVNHDSPGCLVPADGDPQVEGETEGDESEAEPAGDDVPADGDPQVEGETEGDEPALTPPAKNASQKAWAEFAVEKGADPDEVAELSRDDLVELYGT